MGFKSKKGAGGYRPQSGRHQEDPSQPTFKELTDEEKKEYIRNKTAVSRDQDSTPKKQENRYVGSKSQVTISLSSPTAAKRGRGHPTQSPSGPITPRTRQKINTERHRYRRHQQNISKIRSKSAEIRWNKSSSENILHESDIDNSTETLEEINPGVDTDPEESDELRRRLFVKEGDDESEITFKKDKSGRTKENPFGSMSKATYYRHLKANEEALDKHADSWQEKADVTVNLLARSRDIINHDKMQIKISEKAYRTHMKETRYTSGMNRKIGKKANKMRELLNQCSEPEIILEDLLLKNILNQSHLSAVLEFVGVEIESSLKPKFQSVRDMKYQIQSEITSQRHVSFGADRFIANRVAIKLSEKAKLSIDTHGDIEILAKALESSRDYAKRILQSIKSGTTDALLKRDRRKDSIHCSDWPEKLADFAKQPTYSRASPSDTVSIGWKVRAPKYTLNMKRQDVLIDFKKENPDCIFSLSLLNREWPQNVLTPTARDLQRNVCEMHSNARRMERCLRKYGQLIGIHF